MTALPRSSSTATPSTDAATSCSAAARMSSALVPSEPSAMPPTAAMGTWPWLTCSASSRTPSATLRLCETISSPTPDI
jgi:hypothetical protein